MKKSLQILFLFSLLLCLSHSQDGYGAQLLTTTDISDDPLIPSLLNQGLQTVLSAVTQKKQCTNCAYTLSQINSVYRQITTTSTAATYQFNCNFKNSANSVLSATFTVYYDSLNPVSVCQSFSYQISSSSATTTTTTQNAYIQINTTAAQKDVNIKKCLDYGTTQAIQSGFTSGQINSNQYSLSQVNSVYAQSTGNGTNYQFSCQLKSKTSSNTVQATFTVFYDAVTTLTSLASYSYSSTSSSSFSSSFSSSTSSSSTGSATSSIAVSNTSTSASSSSSGAVAAAGTATSQLQQVSVAALSTDSAADYAQTWGANQVIAKGIAGGKIPASSYKVVQVLTVAKQSTSKGYTYQFNILMANSDGVQLSLNYKVAYTTSSQSYSLGAWSYKVSNIKSGGSSSGSYVVLSPAGIQASTAVQAAITWGIQAVIKQAVSQNKIPNTEYSISQLGTISQSVGSKGTYYKCNVLMGNADGVQLIINNTVYFELSTQSYKLNAYSWKATNIKSTSPSSSTSYSNVPSSQYSSSEVQSCLNYGVSNVLKNYQAYSVQTINSISKKTQNSAVYYKMDIILKKKQGNGSAQVNFVVSYQPQLKQFKVSSYSWHTSSSSSYTSSSTTSKSWSTYSSNTTSTVISTSQVNSNTLYKSILNYGVTNCIQSLQTNNIIPLNYFSLSTVQKAWSQTVASGTTNYVFQAVFTDSITTQVTATFTIQYKSSTKTMVLLSYQVNSKLTTQTTSTVAIYSSTASQAVQSTTCQSLTSSQWSASSVQSIIQYGMQQIITALSKISSFSSFSSSSFSVSTVTSVSQSSFDSSVYNIQATFKNQAGKSVDCTYQVQSPSSGSKKLNSYSYVVY